MGPNLKHVASLQINMVQFTKKQYIFQYNMSTRFLTNNRIPQIIPIRVLHLQESDRLADWIAFCDCCVAVDIFANRWQRGQRGPRENVDSDTNRCGPGRRAFVRCLNLGRVGSIRILMGSLVYVWNGWLNVD